MSASSLSGIGAADLGPLIDASAAFWAIQRLTAIAREELYGAHAIPPIPRQKPADAFTVTRRARALEKIAAIRAAGVRVIGGIEVDDLALVAMAFSAEDRSAVDKFIVSHMVYVHGE